MANILVVDDVSVVRTFLVNKLKEFDDKLNFFVAGNGKEAVDCLETNKIDLVLTDLEMPEMDGFELLAYMSSKYPELPAIVMTANWSLALEEKNNQLASIKCFKKPLDIEALSRAVDETLLSRTQGQLQGINLASFLQLVSLESRACTLEITYKGRSGSVSCLDGELINAVTGDVTGEKAAYELISWDRPSIKIFNTIDNREVQIKKPLMSIIMEGMRMKDEKESTGNGKDIRAV